jgi:3-phosphoshikimate 1-carboxyvinyltransferase
MQAIVEPGSIQGTIYVPASKSMMQRVCAAALLHKGKTTIINPGHSHDDITALNILKECGAIVHTNGNTIEIHSSGVKPLTDEISVGESGLSARLFTPILALSDKKITINGKGSLLKRPMNELLHILPELGVNALPIQKPGYLPFSVQGPLQAADIAISGSVSSQYLTGLLFALANAANDKTIVGVENLKSKPYVDMTLEVLGMFGYSISNHNYERFEVHPVVQGGSDVEVTVERDWSSASYWMVAGAIAGSIILPGMNLKSTQADKAIVKVLQLAGARIEVLPHEIRVKKSRLYAFYFDATDCPDLFPVLAILAASSRGESCIKGVHRLVHKESNRAESIAEMLENFGVFHSIHNDCLIIEGRKIFEDASVDSFNDHRIAMAASIGALKASDSVIINGSEAVNKSYPEFFSHLQVAGIECTITD